MKIASRLMGSVLIMLSIGAVSVTLAAEAPKRGGILTYLIPTDSPPSFDGHREWTFATAHSASPFYSLLIQVNPENLSSTTDFVCDLCTEMPTPTDNGTTYTFKIRSGVKFHDGSPLTAADLALEPNTIEHRDGGGGGGGGGRKEERKPVSGCIKRIWSFAIPIFWPSKCSSPHLHQPPPSLVR